MWYIGDKPNLIFLINRDPKAPVGIKEKLASQEREDRRVIEVLQDFRVYPGLLYVIFFFVVLVLN